MGLRQSMESRLRWLLRAASARRIRVFTLAVIATLAFLILPSWNTWNAYRASEQASYGELQLQRLIGTVVHLDEVLTMSARMAAATGDARWEERYRRNEPQLEAAIAETIRRAAGSYVAAAERTDTANRNLVALENRVFDLVRNGQLAEAQEILGSNAYVKSKRDYAVGMQVLTAAIDERIQWNLARSGKRVVGAGALIVVSAGALVLAWVGVVVLIWRHLIAREKAETERRSHEAQLGHVQKLESLGVMAGGIAHDFNNLLMPILGNLDLALSDLPADSPTIPGLRRARDACRRLSDLTNQLMAYSGSVAVDPRPIDLSRLVEEAKDLLEIVVSKNARFRFELADGLPAISGDSSQIVQILMNLVTNASESLGREEGTIAVRTGLVQEEPEDPRGSHLHDDLPKGPRVVLEVSDSGSGMDVATRRRIFDPFFSTKFTGRGLGLAVVLATVRGHRGAVRVDSEPDRGTRFRILFPCADRAAPVQDARPRESVRSWRFAGTVLVVDDEPDLLEIAGEMLRRFGLRVFSAQKGREGVETFRSHAHEIDVVLLDLTMPGLSGEQTLHEIRAIRPDQRVVVMSGYSEEFTASRFEGGIAAFLQKPFTNEQLGETLSSILP